MPGLRDQKKQEARRRIEAAAIGLFAKQGLDGTTMEDVAVAAGVSPATVYNYFGTKTALVVAAVEDDAERIVEDGEAILARPGRSPRAAVQRLIAVYVEHLTSWDRNLLTEVIVAMFQPEGTGMASQMVQIDERAIAQLARLLDHFADKGRIDPEVDTLGAAQLLYSIVLTHMVLWLSVEEFPPVELTKQIDRQIELAFRGIATKGTR